MENGPTVHQNAQSAERLFGAMMPTVPVNAVEMFLGPGPFRQIARDVTLDELHVELIYPADADAETFFRNTR